MLSKRARKILSKATVASLLLASSLPAMAANKKAEGCDDERKAKVSDKAQVGAKAQAGAKAKLQADKAKAAQGAAAAKQEKAAK